MDASVPAKYRKVAMKVIYRDEFTNIVLKKEEFLGTPVEGTLQMFGHVVAAAFLCGDEQGFKNLNKALAIHAENETQRLKGNCHED